MKTKKVSTKIKKTLEERYKPKPIPSFDEYCLKWPRVSSYVKKAISKYECPHCISGRIVAPWEQCDPVEGYKMADRIDCLKCEGTGSWLEEKLKRVWQAEKVQYKKDMAKYRAKKLQLEKVLAIITEQELKVLDEYL